MDKFHNLDEMNQFLKRCKVSQLTQYEIDYLNGPITIKKMKFIIKNCHPKEIYKCPKFTVNITLNGEKYNAFPLRSETKQDVHFDYLYPICTRSSSLCNKIRKGNKSNIQLSVLTTLKNLQKQSYN